MAQTIKLKRSATQSAVPSTSQLELGEVAINTYDGKMFIKKDDGTESIVEVGQFATVTPAGSTGDLQFNNNGTLGAAIFTFVDDANSRLGIGTDTPSTALEVDGTVTATTFDGSLDFSNLTNLPDPTLTLNGDVSGSATLTNLGNATLTVTVANDSHTHDGRYYTETESDLRFVNVAGDTLTGFLTLHADPTNALHAATKEYVDTVAAASLHYHTPVRLESPTALNATYNNGTNGVGATLTNAGTNAALEIDGVATSLNDRVLVYEQSNAAHNGVYTVTTVGDGSTPWVLTRATDADSYAPSDPDSFGQGDAFFVQEGNTGAGELYVMNTEGTITFGTTGINFVQISSAQIYSAGSGLDLTGTQFSHSDTSTQASVDNSGGTVIQDITLDTFGHITAIGSKTLSTSDISEGTNLYYTDARANSAIDARVDKAFVDALNVDADTLDSLNSTAFIRSDVDDTVAGELTLTNTVPLFFENTAEGIQYKPQEASTYSNQRFFLRFDYTNNGSYPYLTNRTPSGDVVIKTGTSAGGAEIERIRFNGGDGTQDIVISSATLKNGSNVYWHAGNDGAGSGLDADLLDGNDASAFVSESGDTMTGDLNFGDNVKAVFGAGSDLQIYHDGSNSYIHENGDGRLYIKAEANVTFTNGAATETYANFNQNGAVTLYYDNSAKFATTTSGADVTGTLTTDGLTVSSNGTFTNPNGVTLNLERNDTNLTDGEFISGLRFGNNDSSGTPPHGTGIKVTADETFGSMFLDILSGNRDAWDASTKAIRIDAAGDISFYEDTGTTPKFFWDASAENVLLSSDSWDVATDTGQAQIRIVTPVGLTGDAGIELNAGSSQPWYIYNTVNDLRFRQDGVDYLNIDTSGNVGIGTSSPSYPLDVRTTVPTVAGFYGDNAYLLVQNKSTGVLNLNSGGTGDSLAFETAGSEAMRINSSGNVGIGTSSPTSILHVVGGNGLSSPAVNDCAFIIGDISASNIAFDANEIQVRNNGSAATLILQKNGGNVSIGHNAPDVQLHIKSATDTFAQVRVEAGADGYDSSVAYSQAGTIKGISGYDDSSDTVAIKYGTFGGAGIDIDSSGNVGIGTTTPITPLEVYSSLSVPLTLTRTGTGTCGIRFSNNSGGRGAIYGEGTSGGLLFFNQSSEAMRIDSSGNLLVGLTSSQNQTGTTEGTSVFSNGLIAVGRNAAASDGPMIRANRIGNAGTIIDLRQDGSKVGEIASVGGADIKVIFSGDGDQYITGNAASNYLTFSSANAERMRIDSSGNVGIGTDSPTEQLDVQLNAIVNESGVGDHGLFVGPSGFAGSFVYKSSGDAEIAPRSGKSLLFATSTGGSEVMRIDSAGRVGIGTTTPTDTLHVIGTARFDNLKIDSSTLGTVDTTQDLIITHNNSSIDVTSADIIIRQQGGGRNGACGDILIEGEDSLGAATGSVITITSGNSHNGQPGDINLTAGSVTGNRNIGQPQDAGDMLFTAGTNPNTKAGAGSRDGGDIVLRAGPNTADNSLNGYIDLQYYDGAAHVSALRVLGSTGNVGIGTTAPSAKLDVAGDIEVNSTFTLNGEEATLATTTQTEIASFSATSYGGGKFVITAKDGSNRHICELLVTHDGTTAVATQYGSIYTSTELATYNVDISSGNVRILATSASSNSTVYKVAETLMEA